MDYKHISYNTKNYIVVIVDNIPILFDETQFDIIKNNKIIIKNEKLYIINNDIEILLCNYLKTYNNLQISYYNNIIFDNRDINLVYSVDTLNKFEYKKRKRLIKLPDNCKINSENIPTYISYMRANDSHGDRFVLEIDKKYVWKTTSSKQYSTEYKFELVKLHLHTILTTKPYLFHNCLMNGEFFDLNKHLLKLEYYNIISLIDIKYNNYTLYDFLNPCFDYLTSNEKKLLCELLKKK